MTKPLLLPLVIGLHSPRGGGKDTLFTRLRQLEPTCTRFAFADALKEQTAPLISKHLGYDPASLTPEQKEVVRHLWIGWGMTCRAHDPLHWVKTVIDNIDHRWVWHPDPFIPVVTDVRFVNEADQLRDHFGSAFRLIDLTRTGAPEPTDEEKRHSHLVAAMADFHLHWGGDDEVGQLAHAQRLLDWLGAEVEQREEVA